MKHLGIVAHSAEGASLCFRSFCQEGFAELGPNAHPDVTLDCIALAHCMPAWDAGDHDSVRGVMAESIDRLARAGSDFFVCPDNTAHIALERPGLPFSLPGLHIAEVVAARAQADGRRRVGVLGTRYTMDGPVYPAALGRRGIAAEVPEAADREAVNRIIFDELLYGRFTPEALAAYVAIIQRLKARGCDAVALVCTEIPLLVTPEASPLPTLDSTRLLARAALEACLDRLPFPTWRGGPIGA